MCAKYCAITFCDLAYDLSMPLLRQVSRTHVGHVTVTPRGADLQSAAPLDVVDRAREVTSVSQAPNKPMSPRGGIAGYTGQSRDIAPPIAGYTGQSRDIASPHRRLHRSVT